MKSIEDSMRGMLVGLAVGDAVGTTNEFKRDPDPISDMVGGGPFFLKAGEWTDDTSMALCLADSLLEMKKFDYVDQLEKYVRWWQHGYNSVTGKCFDIGHTTQMALRNFIITGDFISPFSDNKNGGNGSLMRLAPVVIAYFKTGIMNTCYWAAESSKTTHSALNPVVACSYFAKLLCWAVLGKSKIELESMLIYDLKLTTDLANAVDVDFKMLTRDVVSAPSGYVIDSLRAALFCFYNTDTFKEGCLMAANLGGDADTVAAIYGQLAGAYYGLESIPKEWVNKLAWNNHIIKTADQLSDLSA